ncbi:cardiolipin synthase [Roseivivax lentus]|uniref:Cardiolipin synthase n=1 Tax=Roseivivax lentus TaxID=633194 RepID=A0A1N7NQ45_9RHOB|nr:cardiolipin synthase [Roseivivax lentus]SIT00434.1 cardiolipin synthase [Roseivivax lentus]
MVSIESFAFAILAVLAPTLVVYTVWRAIVSARTPQGAAAWVVFILAAPWFALPSYLVFGRHKLRRYERARRVSRELALDLDKRTDTHRPSEDRRALYAPFERLAGMSVVGGNEAALLIDGQDTFAAIFEAIDAAKSYICVQFYTIVDDGLGGELADKLIAASERGVAVRVMYDGVGSYSLSSAYAERLRGAGVTILDPRKARGPTKRFEVNFRNHRKTVVVDGSVGFVGGHNVSDLYLGQDAPGGRWRDTHVALSGPVVAQLQNSFFEDWHWATQERLDEALDWAPPLRDADLPALILPAGPSDEMDTAALFFFTAISRAQSRVWIASPYFVPDEAILAALKAAALRGCDVRLLLPNHADHYLTWLAAHAYYDEVRAAGVTIHLYDPGFTHQKVVVMDDDMSAIGTANLDNRSFRLNFETMALVFDPAFTAEVVRMLEEDFDESTKLERPLSEQPLFVRMGAPFARLLAPVL